MPIGACPEFLPGLPNGSRRPLLTLALDLLDVRLSDTVADPDLAPAEVRQRLLRPPRQRIHPRQFQGSARARAIIEALMSTSALATIFSLLVTVSSGYILSSRLTAYFPLSPSAAGFAATAGPPPNRVESCRARLVSMLT